MSEVELLARRLEREKRARKEAEALLEHKSRELYQVNQELHHLVAALAEKEARTHAVLEAVVDGIITLDELGTVESCNPAAAHIFGYPASEVIGQLVDQLISTPEQGQPDQDRAADAVCRVMLIVGGYREMVGRRKDGTTVPIEVGISALRLGDRQLYIGIVRDLTEYKRAAAEHHRLQEEIIRVQAAMLVELATPLIPISDHVLVLPLVGTVDTQRTQLLLETLLHGIAERRAEVVILDITGVSIVDTQVANGLIRAAQAVKLLGAQVVLTGIRPEVAQTLVGLGTDLRSIVTFSTLQRGIAFAMR
jgi:rsbT co-antagonist protein RsbR